ncbi:acyltransferase family protein [Tautonia plasticadhaerens]|uniref:Acyltransferase family protein n=1 Tax=Tautonia plasticadhaerens TaxID=2527974 RepID=A0A518H6M3_9BACT|nr:acyltransferase [Tautonia plasticadhaerens]QDV36466.1 Acyltransferase family protein [Tautonia plasticadhaerens]
MELPPLIRNPRYALLDAFRGVACLMVVLHHAGFALLAGETPEPGAFEEVGRWLNLVLRRLDLGVPLFFVISGYCIAASVDATRRRGSSPARFVARRVWRIYPPYWAALAWFLLVTIGLQRLGLERLLCCHSPFGLELILPQDLTAPQWAGNVTLTETWRHLVGGGPAKIFTRVAWSLCFEEQFYFLCFLLLIVASKRLFSAMGWLTLAIVLVRVAAADVGMIRYLEGTFVDLWHQFAVGLAVYWRLNVPSEPWKDRAVEAALVGMAVVGFSARIPNQPVAYSTGTTALFGLLLIGLKDRDAWICSRSWMRPMTFLGRRSYSVYLYHLPVTTVGTFGMHELGITDFWPRALVTVPLVSTLAVLISCGFFQLVERHFLNPPIVGPSRPTAGAGHPLAGESGARPGGG